MRILFFIDNDSLFLVTFIIDHQGAVRENILVDELLSNPNIIYMETKEGNHFGFYEGGVLEACSYNNSYTYPAKVAVSMFDAIIQLDQDCVGRKKISAPDA